LSVTNVMFALDVMLRPQWCCHQSSGDQTPVNRSTTGTHSSKDLIDNNYATDLATSLGTPTLERKISIHPNNLPIAIRIKPNTENEVDFEKYFPILPPKCADISRQITPSRNGNKFTFAPPTSSPPPDSTSTSFFNYRIARRCYAYVKPRRDCRERVTLPRGAIVQGMLSVAAQALYVRKWILVKCKFQSEVEGKKIHMLWVDCNSIEGLEHGMQFRLPAEQRFRTQEQFTQNSIKATYVIKSRIGCRRIVGQPSPLRKLLGKDPRWAFWIGDTVMKLITDAQDNNTNVLATSLTNLMLDKPITVEEMPTVLERGVLPTALGLVPRRSTSEIIHMGLPERGLWRREHLKLRRGGSRRASTTNVSRQSTLEHGQSPQVSRQSSLTHHTSKSSNDEDNNSQAEKQHRRKVQFSQEKLKRCKREPFLNRTRTI